MKNREKYPNTDEALKAFEKHKKECNCDCTFETWLDVDEDKIDALLGASTFGPVGLAAAFLAFSRAKSKAEKTTSAGVEELSKHITNVECPICHGKNGKIDSGLFIPSFSCPDCGAYVGINKTSAKTPFLGLDSFKSFIADLCTKNSKKD
jgi:endogenous inhibitor of DNA gyrase (YacG/DUF329 family)